MHLRSDARLHRSRWSRLHHALSVAGYAGPIEGRANFVFCRRIALDDCVADPNVIQQEVTVRIDDVVPPELRVPQTFRPGVRALSLNRTPFLNRPVLPY